MFRFFREYFQREVGHFFNFWGLFVCYHGKFKVIQKNYNISINVMQAKAT